MLAFYMFAFYMFAFYMFAFYMLAFYMLNFYTLAFFEYNCQNILSNIYISVEKRADSKVPETFIIQKEMSISTLKGAYWINSNCEIFQYCDSNIGLFSNAPNLVVALNLFASNFI